MRILLIYACYLEPWLYGLAYSATVITSLLVSKKNKQTEKNMSFIALWLSTQQTHMSSLG